MSSNIDFNPLIQRPYCEESVENKNGTSSLQWSLSLILSSKIQYNYGAVKIN